MLHEDKAESCQLLYQSYQHLPMPKRRAARMRIVSFITEPRVIDRILRHRESERCQAQDPFEPRAPPRPHARSRQ